MTSLSRRTFISLIISGAATGGCVLTTLVLRDFLKPIAPRGDTGTRLYAGRLIDFEIDTVTRVQAARGYVVRTEAGLLAMKQTCTHLGCAVQWNADADRFQCHCHGSEFDRHGVVLDGPAPRPLDVLPISLADDEVWIDAAGPIEREHFTPDQITLIEDAG
jgi:cytochrome b6-f complex iron-sulfur subunit